MNEMICQHRFKTSSQCTGKARYEITYKDGSKLLFCGRHAFDVGDNRIQLRILNRKDSIYSEVNLKID